MLLHIDNSFEGILLANIDNSATSAMELVEAADILYEENSEARNLVRLLL
jgi:hypothetical protein